MYFVSGTIGQPDAGPTMTGGQYSLTGGFWALPQAVRTPGAPLLSITAVGPGFATICWTPDTPRFVLQVDPSNNGDEFIAGTDPTNAASFFSMTKVAPLLAGFELQWDAVTGRLYSVHWTGSLTNSFQTLEADIAYPQNTDTVHTVDAQGFYHMEVKLVE